MKFAFIHGIFLFFFRLYLWPVCCLFHAHVGRHMSFSCRMDWRQNAHPILPVEKMLLIHSGAVDSRTKEKTFPRIAQKILPPPPKRDPPSSARIFHAVILPLLLPVISSPPIPTPLFPPLFFRALYYYLGLAFLWPPPPPADRKGTGKREGERKGRTEEAVWAGPSERKGRIVNSFRASWNSRVCNYTQSVFPPPCADKKGNFPNRCLCWEEKWRCDTFSDLLHRKIGLLKRDSRLPPWEESLLGTVPPSLSLLRRRHKIDRLRLRNRATFVTFGGSDFFDILCYKGEWTVNTCPYSTTIELKNPSNLCQQSKTKSWHREIIPCVSSVFWPCAKVLWQV